MGLTGWLLENVGVSLRPNLTGTRFLGGKGAGCCISLDFDVTQDSRSASNHKGSHLLLSHADKYEIPLTWAICGSTAERDPEPLRAILDSGDSHEIASHTYSHLRVDQARPEELEADHQRWSEAVGVPARSFVFPYNKMGNFTTLKSLGFVAYRGEVRVIGAPFEENGMRNIPPVMYLNGRTEGTVGTARGFVDLCIRSGGVFHLWSHPWNLAREGDPERFCDRVLAPILAYIKEKENEGVLGLYTMNQLTEPSLGQAS